MCRSPRQGWFRSCTDSLIFHQLLEILGYYNWTIKSTAEKRGSGQRRKPTWSAEFLKRGWSEDLRMDSSRARAVWGICSPEGGEM